MAYIEYRMKKEKPIRWKLVKCKKYRKGRKGLDKKNQPESGYTDGLP